MKITKILKDKYIIMILMIICTHISHAQLTVSATATDEECPGTGTLSLSVQNANPSYPVNYKVYLLPETNVPFWNSSNSYIEGLQDGDYLIKASQDINGSVTTAQTQATIGSNYTPLSFYVSSVNAVCGNDGTMVIEVTSGNPAMYEILDGPATAGPQASNIFSGLPAGTYDVRVTDVCGNGFISTQTFYVEQPELSIAGPELAGGEITSCNEINVSYTVSAEEGLGIVYPLSVQIKVYPPSGGTPVTYNKFITTGPQTGLDIIQSIQFYGASHNIDIAVTDPCGTTYTLNGGVVQAEMTSTATLVPGLCNEITLQISPQNFKAPYTINFTNTPAGFNPSAYNNTYPGPYSTAAIFGSEQNAVPMGNYSFTITDACGRTATNTILVEELPAPEPDVIASNHDCINLLGSVMISITGHPLSTASITSAPAGYQNSTPYNVTSQIEEGMLNAEDLPIGDYTFTLTDICGNTYENIQALVPGYSPAEPTNRVRPDCEIGKGTVRIRSNLSSVTITSAPAGFQHTLPYNASENINNGTFAMAGLPAGEYEFSLSTECESGIVQIIDIPGLEITKNEVDTTSDCNAFNVLVNYESNADDITTFWLQKYNDELNQWVHPETGAPYVEGDVLSAENAVELANGVPNNSFSYIGDLRVMKMQLSFASPTTGRSTTYCVEDIHEFFFYNELEIRGVYNLTCVGEVIDVMVDAVGVSPLTFEIVARNGDPSFYVNNGDSNVFTSLTGGLYHVRVTDPCGGYRVQQFNVSELPPLVSATTPPDMGWCDLDGTGAGYFDLTSQNAVIIDDLDPEIVTITYHTSMADAENDSNPITNPSSYTSAAIEIFARVEWNVNPICYGLASFNLVVTPPTPLAMQDKWGYCEGESVTVVADPGYVSYSWSTGETTSSIDVSEPGEYTCTVVSGTGCEITKTIEVAPVLPPEITRVDIRDFNGDNNTITIYMDYTPNLEFYEYSLDGLNYQQSNVFEGIPAGQYEVIVRDRFNCGGGDSKEIHLLDYPKYFTPNGDGVNDTWRIPYAILEPGMTVLIYDRYGKPITSFGATSEGWDGTLEGRHLPSTDYWFIVKRQDGREFRGHFAMMR